MVEEHMQVVVRALQSRDDDLRSKGSFPEVWSQLKRSVAELCEIAVDVEALKVFQRPDFRIFFHEAPDQGMATFTNVPPLSEKQVDYLGYLASLGGNLMVFFSTRSTELLRALEAVVGGRFEVEEMPPITSHAQRYLDTVLGEDDSRVILAFAHDGEPMYCFASNRTGLV
jgi:hypothetical protein